MSNNKLSVPSMISVILAALLIAGSLFLPWWGMKFYAPQYPEGLDIIVYPNKLAGQIEIVNGLNHYIGMKPFSEETFPELGYLPYLLGGMVVLTLIVAFIRNKFLLYGLILLFVVGGALGLWDMNRWLTSFGTELDPRAPIKVPPFVPPIIGKNVLANFVTYSYFTTGGYLIGIAFLLLLAPLFIDNKKKTS